MGVTVDNVEDLQKQIAKLDRIMAKSLQRRGEIEQILFDVATGKLPPPSPQDCRVLALKLGTDKADWPEQIANHVWQGNTERDALAAELEILAAFRDEVVGVMNNSQGVAGWHHNHTIATWDELFPVVPDIESPAACLAQVRAEAVIEAVNFFHPSLDIDAEALKSYAERIRQEKNNGQ